MPFFDRFWWLRALAGLVGLGGIAPLALDIYFTSDEGLRNLLAHDFMGYLLVLLVILEDVVIFWLPALRARRRKRARVAAMRGVTSAIPVAPVTIKQTAAPDLTEGSLALLWRQPIKEQQISSRMRKIRIVLAVVYAPVLAVQVWFLARQFQSLGLATNGVMLGAAIYGVTILVGVLSILLGTWVNASRKLARRPSRPSNSPRWSWRAPACP